MKKALIITYNKFPNGDAGSVRQFIFSKLLIELGYEIDLIGMGESTSLKWKRYENINYTSFRENSSSKIAKLKNFFGYGIKLKKHLKNKKYDLLIVIDLPLYGMHVSISYAKKNNIPIIHDSVEWYSPEQFSLGKYSIEYLRKDIKNRFYFKKPWKIIAISRYLESHFKYLSLNTIYIPVILDINNITYVKRNIKNKIVILYAGALGNKKIGIKDYVSEMLDALLNLSLQEREKVEFRILGSTEKELKSIINISPKNWDVIKNSIVCKGRVSREIVFKNLEEATFTLLLRDSTLRYSKAGFSTKIVESLATGTPILCNLSGDLKDYLIDGINSIIINSLDKKELVIALKRIIKYTDEEKNLMFKNSRKTAEQYFDYRLFKEKFNLFLNNN